MWNSLTVGHAVRIGTTRRGHIREVYKVPGQFNREGSLRVLHRLAPCEKCLERLLRIIRPHPLREYFVLKFNSLLHLFA